VVIWWSCRWFKRSKRCINYLPNCKITQFTLKDKGLLNDLWRYRVNDSTWTWIAGSNTINQQGVYGEKGNASTTNIPGSRREAVGWYDSLRQEFWLFGGYGYSNNTVGMSY